MSETDIVNDIRLKLYADFPNARLFRNNNGRLQDITGGYITYGLGPGTSDLVGFRRQLITPDMVGTTLAQFIALEVKKPGARTAAERLKQQRDFVQLVCAWGGVGAFVDSYDAARTILNQS